MMLKKKQMTRKQNKKYPVAIIGKELICLLTLFFSKSSAHDDEVRKLYEEMEFQIKQEKERVLAEVTRGGEGDGAIQIG